MSLKIFKRSDNDAQENYKVIIIHIICQGFFVKFSMIFLQKWSSAIEVSFRNFQWMRDYCAYLPKIRLTFKKISQFSLNPRNATKFSLARFSTFFNQTFFSVRWSQFARWIFKTIVITFCKWIQPSQLDLRCNWLGIMKCFATNCGILANMGNIIWRFLEIVLVNS